jgi:hypothetical protein
MSLFAISSAEELPTSEGADSEKHVDTEDSEPVTHGADASNYYVVDT